MFKMFMVSQKADTMPAQSRQHPDTIPTASRSQPDIPKMSLFQWKHDGKLTFQRERKGNLSKPRPSSRPEKKIVKKKNLSFFLLKLFLEFNSKFDRKIKQGIGESLKKASSGWCRDRVGMVSGLDRDRIGLLPENDRPQENDGMAAHNKALRLQP